jgi:7-cyano-7-deazaguanine synthase in queuosine biosynthesis
LELKIPVTSKHSYQNICTSQWLPYEVNFIISFGILYGVCGGKQETENLFMCIKCYNGQTKEDKMGVACGTCKKREDTYKDFVGTHEGMRPLVKPRHT